MTTEREGKTIAVKLDWSKLLGFDQADRTATSADGAKLTDPRIAKVGNKAGTKFGLKGG